MHVNDAVGYIDPLMNLVCITAEPIQENYLGRVHTVAVTPNKNHIGTERMKDVHLQIM